MVDIDALYRKWERVYGIGVPNLTYPSLKGLYQWFLRECERKGIDPETIDFEALIDPCLTYEENKTILAEMMVTPPTEKEYEAMYEEMKSHIQKEVREKYPEVIQPLEEKIAELERIAKGAERYKKMFKELKLKLEETERRLEEERAKPPEVAAVKLRVLKDFEHGIERYRVGTVFETRDVDWALELIDKKFVERIPPEVPVYVPPPAKELTKEQIKRLEDEFKAILMKRLGRIPRDVMAEFRVELEALKFLPYEDAVKAIERLGGEIVERELVRPPPPVRPPPVPPEVIVPEVPPPPAVEVPKEPLSPLRFPRRPASEELKPLWEAFVYRMWELGLDPWDYRDWYADYVENAWFSSWSLVVKRFEALITDIKEGKPKFVPRVYPPWEIFPRDPVLHLLATGKYATMDELLQALNAHGVFLEPEDVIAIVKEDWAKGPELRASWLKVAGKDYLEKVLGVPLET